MELVFLNKTKTFICEDHIDDSTPTQYLDPGQIWYVDNKLETYLDMDISDNDKPKYYGEVEIYEMLDSPQETINSEDLDNQSTQKLEDAQDSRELKIHDMLDAPEEKITSEELDNQSTQRLEDAQDSGESEYKE